MKKLQLLLLAIFLIHGTVFEYLNQNGKNTRHAIA